MANLSKTTQDHDEIRNWAEERGGKPSHVKSTGSSEDIGILRIDFPGYSGEGSLEQIAWDAWFEKFDERNLALLYQEETAEGERSNFNKIVNAGTNKSARSGSRRKGGSKKSTAKKSASASSRRASGNSRKAIKKTATKKTAAKSSTKKAPAKKSAVKKAAAKKTSAKSAKRPSKSRR